MERQQDMKVDSSNWVFVHCAESDLYGVQAQASSRDEWPFVFPVLLGVMYLSWCAENDLYKQKPQYLLLKFWFGEGFFSVG